MLKIPTVSSLTVQLCPLTSCLIPRIIPRCRPGLLPLQIFEKNIVFVIFQMDMKVYLILP